MKHTHMIALLLAGSLAGALAPHAVAAQAAPLAGPASQQAPTLERIRQRGYLIVGNEFKFPTMNAIDAASGRNEGFMADLARLLARRLFNDDSKVQFRLTDDATRLNYVTSGEVDMLIDTTGGIADNAALLSAKKKVVDFSDETFRSGSALLVRKGSAIHAIDDIGKGTRVLYAKANPDIALIKAHSPDASYLEFDSSADALAALKAGKGDVLTQVVTHLYRAASQDSNYTVVGRFTAKSYAIVFQKGDSELGAYLNDWLRTIKSNGDYDRLYQKWFAQYGGNALR